MKTSELTGARLDYWVAKAQLPAGARLPDFAAGTYAPSTNWEQGGPIIQREGICIAQFEYETPEDQRWRAGILDGGGYFASLDLKDKGPTPLIAAMRAFVASKYGDEVEDLDKR